MTKLTGAFCDYTHTHIHLKWTIKKCDSSIWTGFVRLTTGKSARPL